MNISQSVQTINCSDEFGSIYAPGLISCTCSRRTGSGNRSAGADNMNFRFDSDLFSTVVYRASNTADICQ